MALALALFAAGAAHAALPQWSVRIVPNGQVFPALALSQAPLPPGTGSGLVSVQVSGPGSDQPLTLTLATAGLVAPAQLAVGPATVPGPRRLQPRLDWDPAALRALGEPRRQPLTVTLAGPGFGTLEQTLDITLHPLDEALYFVREGGEQVDLGWIFAGYVDPGADSVAAILAAARAIRADFDTAPAVQRVAAVWAALEQRGLRYADGDPALARGPVLWSQRVRLPAATWEERRANCIDGSVLIASVLERLGLAPFIVLLPGHALVGFDDGAGHPVVLETTLLGAQASAAANFAAARRIGGLRWRTLEPRLDGRHGPDYALVDIATARRYGIMPLRIGARSDPDPAQAAAPAAVAPSRRGQPQ